MPKNNKVIKFYRWVSSAVFCIQRKLQVMQLHLLPGYLWGDVTWMFVVYRGLLDLVAKCAAKFKRGEIYLGRNVGHSVLSECDSTRCFWLVTILFCQDFSNENQTILDKKMKTRVFCLFHCFKKKSHRTVFLPDSYARMTGANFEIKKIDLKKWCQQ